MNAFRLFIACAAFNVISIAQAAVIPDPIGHLRDLSGVLDTSDRSTIESICLKLDNDTSAEIGLLILPSTDGENHHDFAVRAFNKWGIGKRGANNGLLILIAIDDRRAEIVPGDGIQKQFTPQYCTALLQHVLVPRMKLRQYASGSVAIVTEVAKAVRHFRHTGQNPSLAGIPAYGLSDVKLSELGSHMLMVVFCTGWSVAVLLGCMFFFSGVLRISRAWLAFFFTLSLIPLSLFAWQTVMSWPVTEYEIGVVVFTVVSLVLFILWWLSTCPNCGIKLQTYSHVLRHPTYLYDGTGQRTWHCSRCHYHEVNVYSIDAMGNDDSYSSRSSSSYRSSSSSGSSFGGGYSSGGGGGASW